MSPSSPRWPLLPFLIAALILLLGCAASFYQFGVSDVFLCGKERAGDRIWYLAFATAVQSLLFLWSGWSATGVRWYRATQWVALPLIGFAVYQLSALHARSLLLLCIGVAVYVMVARTLDRRRGVSAEADWARLCVEGVLFVLAALVIHSALAFLALYSRGLRLSDGLFGGILLVSALIAFAVVRRGCRCGGPRLNDIPPLFLLLMILLRAKVPDTAYDSLFYKVTLPLMIADWRTALTGLPDHTLMGTNLQEIINSQLRILDGGFAPSFLSTLAFCGLWPVAPAAARACANLLPAQTSRALLGLAVNAAALLIVSLTEPLLASGTSYQEPLQVLLLCAGLLAGPAGWLFLSAAAAVKVTSLLFLPFFMLVRAAGRDREAVYRWLESPIATLRERFAALRDRRKPAVQAYAAPGRGALAIAVLCGVLAVLVFGEQLARNQVLSGRLLVPSEMLAGLTDPDGRVMSRVERDGTFDAASKRNAFDNLVSTVIHMGTLDAWMTPEEHGFHVLPSSRLPLVAVFLGLLALWCARKQETRPWALFALLHTALFVIYLQFFLQGRHMVPASFAAIAVIVAAPAFLWRGDMRRAVLASLTVVFACLAVGDQLIGNFLNDGWDCRRGFAAPAAEPITPTPPESVSGVDRKLAEIVADYRSHGMAAHYIVPTVLCDQHTESKAYFGAHFVYSSVTQSLLRRYFKADPARLKRLAGSVLAVCILNRELIAADAEALKDDFTFAGRFGFTDIYVSKVLAQGGPAAQIVPSGFPVPPALRGYTVAKDFGAAWSSGKLADESPKPTPTGRGALVMTVGDRELPTLVSANALAFEGVEVRPGDRVRMEATLPFGQSDGLRVELRLDLPGAAPLVRELLIRRKRTAAADGKWYSENLVIPDGFAGTAKFTVRAGSEGGDPDADWIAFRKLHLLRPTGY